MREGDALRRFAAALDTANARAALRATELYGGLSQALEDAVEALRDAALSRPGELSR